MYKKINLPLSVFLLSLVSLNVFAATPPASAPVVQASTAQPAQDNNPLLIDSEQTQMDMKTGKNVYQGNVVITHGKSRLAGDIVTTYRDQKTNKINKVVTVGKQATLHAEEQQDEKPVDAKANTITFFPATHDVTLEGDAVAVQDKNVIHAPVIKYNTETKVMNAESSKKEKLHILIYNDQNQTSNPLNPTTTNKGNAKP